MTDVLNDINLGPTINKIKRYCLVPIFLVGSLFLLVKFWIHSFLFRRIFIFTKSANSICDLTRNKIAFLPLLFNLKANKQTQITTKTTKTKFSSICRSFLAFISFHYFFGLKYKKITKHAHHPPFNILF